jgi:hypothetical protein
MRISPKQQVTARIACACLASASLCAQAPDRPRQVYWDARPIIELLRPDDRAVEIIYIQPDFVADEPTEPSRRAESETRQSELVVVLNLTSQQPSLVDEGKTIVTNLRGRVQEVLFHQKGTAPVQIGSEIEAQMFGGRITLNGVQVEVEGHPSAAEMPNDHPYLLFLVEDQQDSDQLFIRYVPLRIDDGRLHYVTHVKHPIIPSTPLEGMRLSEFARIAARVK